MGENVTFNVTLIPTPSEEVLGTLYVKNLWKNWEDAINPVSLKFDNGTALVNVSLSEAGEYEAVAVVGTAEQHYWFRTSSFFFIVYHDKSTHEIKPEDNVTIAFQLLNRTGQAEYTSIDINVTQIRNARTWSTVLENVL